MNKNKFDNGTIKISNDIFYTISAIAATEIEGVRSIVGVNSDAEKVNAKNSKKGIDVSFSDKGVEITTKVVLEYGNKIDDLVKKIQENIKLKIEVMTGIKVISVNIVVDSIEK